MSKIIRANARVANGELIVNATIEYEEDIHMEIENPMPGVTRMNVPIAVNTMQCCVELTCDWDRALHRLGVKAAKNVLGRSQVACGILKVKRVGKAKLIKHEPIRGHGIQQV